MLLGLRNLHATVDDVAVLHGVTLSVQAGEIHLLMGPNGSGKSSLAATVAGHPSYRATGGTATLGGRSLLKLAPEERARRGLFLAFQHPTEVPGVSVRSFLKASVNQVRAARGEAALSVRAFRVLAAAALRQVRLPERFLDRGVNERFSGGEKKRFELAQLMLLEPKIAILDETDSGLDVDAVRLVGETIAELAGGKRPGFGAPAFLIISHSPRLLTQLTPTYVHVMADGRIVESGGPELAERIERDGYGWLAQVKSQKSKVKRHLPV